jgi:hypothetical protein
VTGSRAGAGPDGIDAELRGQLADSDEVESAENLGFVAHIWNSPFGGNGEGQDWS